jgi:GNAT superfamily N-acetyltransferase
MEYYIREKTGKDNPFLILYVSGQWGSPIIVTRQKKHNIEDLDGLLACNNDGVQGIILYEYYSNQCEIVLLESLIRNIGIGTALLNKVVERAKADGIQRIWLITTNDNIQAIKFYQRYGFVFSNIYINAIEESRKIKKEIPYTGNFDIPIRDEIEFEMKLI